VLPDDRIVSGSEDATIKIWDVSGKCLTTFSGHTGWVNALAVLPDGRLVSGSVDTTLRLWNTGLRPLALLQLKPLLLALQKNRSIRQLNLQNTRLTDEDIPHLIELLTPNTTVTEIDIRSTAITQKGVETFHWSLTPNHLLRRGLRHEAMFAIYSKEVLEHFLPSVLIHLIMHYLSGADTQCFHESAELRPAFATTSSATVPITDFFASKKAGFKQLETEEAKQNKVPH
ncbi:MAG: hypothetical protein JSR33_10955, partial [Proteobacteria bacterium]|nr:hypothetical protein [Pseudomonadota bacterium]